MIEFFKGRLHIAWGRREWELQGWGENHGPVNFSGHPYLTKREARKGRELWRSDRYLFESVKAINVRTGERLR